MEKLCLGTYAGLFIIEIDENDGIVKTEKLFPGTVITGVAADSSGKVIYVSAREANGFYKVNLDTMQITLQGKDVLGKVRCVAISPWDDNEIWVGTEPAGMFSSTDGGTTWTESVNVRRIATEKEWVFPNPRVDAHIRWIDVSPVNKNRIWAAGQIGGLLRSDDRGESWTNFTGLDPDVHMVKEINEQLVYASCGGGGWVDETLPPPLPRGLPLYKSNDLGNSWEILYPYVMTDTGRAVMERTYATSLWVDPEDDQRVLMGVSQMPPIFWLNRVNGANAIIILTTDGGRSWNKVTEGLPDYFMLMPDLLFGSLKDPNTVFAVTGGEGVPYIKNCNGQIFRSTNKGQSWQKLEMEFPPALCAAVLPQQQL